MRARPRLIPIDLAAIRRGDATADVQLMPYDLLVIKMTARSGSSLERSFWRAK